MIIHACSYLRTIVFLPSKVIYVGRGERRKGRIFVLLKASLCGCHFFPFDLQSWFANVLIGFWVRATVSHMVHVCTNDREAHPWDRFSRQTSLCELEKGRKRVGEYCAGAQLWPREQDSPASSLCSAGHSEGAALPGKLVQKRFLGSLYVLM